MPKNPEKFDKFDPEKTIYFSPEERAKFAEQNREDKKGREEEKNRPFEFLSEQLDQIKIINELKLPERGKYDEAEEILKKIEQSCADNSDLWMRLPADLRRDLDRKTYLIREKIGEYKELDLPEEERTRRKAEKDEKRRESEGRLAETLRQSQSEVAQELRQKHEKELSEARSKAEEAFEEKEEE